MKTFIQKNKKVILAGFVFLVLGLIAGKLIFTGTGSSADTEMVTEHEHEDETFWTCSMHPQVKQEEPGQCPICGMDLIPLEDAGSSEIDPNQIQMTESAVALANIQTTTVEQTTPYKSVTLSGKVEADERNVAEITARFPGRIEQLYINFTGQVVARGQRLVSIYSPELVTAQKELFEAAKFKDSSPEYYKAARNKLKLWDLSDEQINEIEQHGEPRFYFDVQATHSGTVTERKVSKGDYVKVGDPLFEIVDLSAVWVLFDAYESDIPWIRVGDKIDFTIKSIPGKTFTSKVTFIDPLINPQTRVAQVRTELRNPNNVLKPDMLAQGVFESKLPGVDQALIIPKSAVLWTGKRAVVYVEDPTRQQPTFEYREVQLGEDAGDYYIVQSGLSEGEVVASNGVFRIDAAAQLQGKKSMMNPEGGKAGTRHNHGGMEMEDQNESNGERKHNPAEKIDEKQVPAAFHKQMNHVTMQYLKIKNALVESDAQAAQAGVESMQSGLDKVDMSLLKGATHDTWMDGLNQMKTALRKMEESSELQGIRRSFSDLSDALIMTLQALGTGPSDIRLYVQFCPMANNNNGGYWVSKVEEIKNPFFGEQMMTCGEVTDSIK